MQMTQPAILPLAEDSQNKNPEVVDPDPMTRKEFQPSGRSKYASIAIQIQI
jgi:hypothetical protein